MTFATVCVHKSVGNISSRLLYLVILLTLGLFSLLNVVNIDVSIFPDDRGMHTVHVWCMSTCVWHSVCLSQHVTCATSNKQV
jgi:hypothetical protein